MKKLLLSISLIALTSTINAQWTSQGPTFPEISRGIGEIKIVDANTVWALAYDGAPITATHTAPDNVQEFTLTTDGGATWTAPPSGIDVGDTTLIISNISPVSATTAWAGAFDTTLGLGGVFKTSDGGQSWIPQNNSGTAYTTAGESWFDAVHFFDANVGLTLGDPESGEFEIYKTTDGGDNWTRIAAAALPNPLTNEYGYTDGYVGDSNNFWFVTNKGRIYKTLDKGVTWTVAQAPLTDFGGIDPTSGNGTRGDVYFSNATTGYLLKTVIAGSTTAHTYTYTYYTTTNGGTTWSTGSAFTGTRTLLSYVPGTTTMVATSAAAPVGTSISTDNGTTWTDLEPGGTTQRGVGAYLTTSIGWCGGFSDGDPTGTMGIYKLSGSLANQNFATTKFSVYPNPATSNVTIATTGVDAYQLEVTDLLGKVIMTKSLSGIENTVDISSLTAGVYLFTLNSDNKKQTVKILKN